MTFEEAAVALNRGELEWRTDAGEWRRLTAVSGDGARITAGRSAAMVTFNQVKFSRNSDRYRVRVPGQARFQARRDVSQRQLAALRGRFRTVVELAVELDGKRNGAPIALTELDRGLIEAVLADAIETAVRRCRELYETDKAT